MIDAYDKLKQARQVAKENGIPVLREQSYNLLLTLVAGFKPQRILEIGTAWGYSGIAMLLASPTSHLTGIELDDDCIKRTRANYAEYGVTDRATLFTGDAGEIIPVLTGNYDFIFLDGPKGHYFEYLPHLLSVLNNGGILFADNVLFRGYVGDRVKTPRRFNTTKHSMERFLKAITDDKNLNTVVIDIEDGISITEKL